jgi:hypothetical protein
MAAKVRIGLSVVTDDPQLVAKVTEQMARTAAGLALEGVDAMVMVGPDDFGDDDV